MNYCQFRNQTIKRMANAGSVTPILPAEYQQVEYLQSSGTQYINIGAISNHQYYDIDFTWLNYVNNTGGSYGVNGLLGINAYNSQGIPDVKVWLRQNNSIGSYIGTTTIGACSINTGVKYNAYFSPTSFKVDNVDYTAGSGQFNASVDCYIFSIHSRDGDSNKWGCAVKIYNLQTSSINLYPCYRKADNKPGMYDLVTNTFFTNAGTGEFTVGNNV